MFILFIQIYSQLPDDGEIELENGLQFMIDGGDTVFIDEPDTAYEMMHLSEPSSYSIEVKLSSNIAGPDEDLFGSNIADIFSRKHEPEGVFGIDQWQLLSDLKPNVIRIPSGGSSTLMHLLHHPLLDSDADGENDLSQGYGYVIEEIVNYFDYADGEFNDPDISSILTIDDKNVAISLWADPLTGWIKDIKLAGQCFDYVQKYKDQLLLPPGTRYIDAFLRLIQKIETDNPGLRVKVIVCLNIVSETAEEGKAIVEYLRNNTIYNVEVYGVEMGNECYDTFFQKAMGFTTFDFYYGYLIGETVPGFDVNAVLREDMEGAGHEFLQTFKNDIDFNCKVGVVGDDNPDHSDNKYVLKRDEEVPELVIPSWNTQIPPHYNELIPVAGTPFTRKAFDAVILHPYYGIDNYKHEIVDLDYLLQTYACGIDGIEWNFTGYDTRLQPAFDLMTDKFISLFRTGFKESFERWSDDLGFYAGATSAKELWTTEWNYKDAGNIDDNDLNRMGAFSNSFLQGMVVFEWNLKNLKINFDPVFQNHFMPLSTYHNFGGGGNAEMLNFADQLELVHYNLAPDDWMTADLCDPAYWAGSDDPLRQNYYLKHTPYFAHELISDIYANDLQYMKTNFKVPPALITDNLQPTVFVDPLKENIYLFYSNVRGHKQNYVLNTTGMLPLFPGATGIDLGVPVINCLDADYPYSTAGRCTLYQLNTCYDLPGYPDNCTDITATMPYPIDLNDLSILPPEDPECYPDVPEAQCVTVRAYSFGYIKVPIQPIYEHKEENISISNKIRIYPNPTDDYITIAINGLEENYEKIHVEIYDIEGILVKSCDVQNFSQISVCELGQGCYQIVIKETGMSKNITSFIKI